MTRPTGGRLVSMKLVLLFLWHLSICLAGPSIEKLPPPPFDEEVDNGSHGYYPGRTYVTAEGVKSPDTQFVQWSPECDDGLNYFLTPRGHSIPRPGPVILDRRGELIWGQHFANSYGGEAYNFLVQNYKGEDYLTFWLGDDRIRGHGSGFYYMVRAKTTIMDCSFFFVLTMRNSLIRLTMRSRKLAVRMD